MIPLQTLRLKPLQVPGFPSTIELVEGHLTIGRSTDSDLVFSGDVFPSVSTHHCRLEERENGLWLEDLGSKNGTLVNGKPIAEAVQLRSGDVVQLGSIGPRFVVVSSGPLSETMFVDPKAMGSGEMSETQVTELVHRRSRRIALRVVALGTVAMGAIIWWGLDIAGKASREIEHAEEELADALEVISGLTAREAEHAADIEQLRESRAAYIDNLRQAIEGTESAAELMRARLASLEQTGASATEIARLEGDIANNQRALVQARTEFEMFDPINLEQARLSGVSDVRESVVLLEVEMMLENEENGEVMRVTSTGELNFDGNGIAWSLESTGSGFCISPDGWILTNAHVVEPSGDHELVMLTQDVPISPTIQVQAVFSGTSERHRATVVRIDKSVDLALIKITPYEGMPCLEGLRVDVEPPEPGTDVFLFGFPLGKYALQEGRTVIASTFRGILSRNVDGNMQVDAGVHPGNSGGPITDAAGRVIGVVFSVQALPDQTAVFTIGYGIPIHEAAKIWPPPEDWAPE